MQPNLTRLFALDGRRALVTGAWGLGSNGTESALKPSACPQTLVASG